MSEEKLEVILREKKLRNYILGLGEFYTIRPDVDYNRWLKIKDFYKNPLTQAQEKAYVEEVIGELFSSQESQEQHVGVLLSRVLSLPNTKEKIINLMLDKGFQGLSQRVKDELCYSASLLQIHETRICVVEYFLKQNRLRNFIFNSRNPPYISQVDANDIWRLEAIHEFFNISSNELRKKILMEIDEAFEDGENFRLLVSIYIDKKMNVNSEFVQHLIMLVGVV